MKKQRGDAEVFASIILLLICWIVWMFFANWECKSKWEKSGMSGVTWGPVQGCLVKLPDGRWLPEERIREIDITPKPKQQPTKE